MFHTPPSVNPIYDQESRKNSYFSDEDSKIIINDNKGGDQISSMITSNNSNVNGSDNGNGNENENDGNYRVDDELPRVLAEDFDRFVASLKKPKFNHPLDLNDIASLYQQFYKDFSYKNAHYVKNKYNKSNSNNINKPIELLNKEEILLNQKTDISILQEIYKNNVLVEDKICNKFYSKIFKSKKLLKNDQLENLINNKLNKKLKILQKINISLKSLDLNVEIENIDNFLKDLLLKEFLKLNFEIKSPTSKLLQLKKIHELINQLFKNLEIEINGDFYLPILIYTIIKFNIDDLYLNLNFIKRFRNANIYYNGGFKEDECGKLLYVLTNFEACLMYLINVTVEDLNISKDEAIKSYTLEGDNNREVIKKQEFNELISAPINIDPEILSYCEDFKLNRKIHRRKKSINNNNNVSELEPIDSTSTFFLPELTLYNADQSIRTIGAAFDSSVKNIFGRVADIVDQTGVLARIQEANSSEISNKTKQQIEENFKNLSNNTGEDTTVSGGVHEQEKEEKENENGNGNENENTKANGNENENDNDNETIKLDNTNTNTNTNLRPELLSPISTTSSSSTTNININNINNNNSNNNNNSSSSTPFNKLSHSVSGVMKTFRPISNSNSSTSLSSHLEPELPQRRNRSRTTSLIGSVFNAGNINNYNNSSASKSTTGFMSSIEQAFETKNTNAEIVETLRFFKKKINLKDRVFEDLQISELKEIFQDYQKILDQV
ncbi:hypothetical protein PACTADRAFT_2853 [Pachysolen tannophilus NRRL Y-2460]|uniref:VPS9 domain-containing protein n=1 Tax=Pachysolen tannophilus NRRL Y-2460 TaxID=669874 RepID=A0A1E4TTM9_PACTA|nr:hypothetical protein PACTADRAFT_2853 [Pachysolen tannophilus NRRL Y-2460]